MAKSKKTYPVSKGKTLTQSFLAASRAGQINRMRSYLNQGADINAQDEESLRNLGTTRNTALMWNCKSARHKVVDFLLAAGANPVIKNAAGETLLHHCDERFIGKLVAAGVDINARDHKGHTPFTVALEGRKGVGHLEKLLDAGADPNLDNALEKVALLARPAYAALTVSEQRDRESYQALYQRMEGILAEKTRKRRQDAEEKIRQKTRERTAEVQKVLKKKAANAPKLSRPVKK